MNEKRIIVGLVALATLLPQLLGCIWGPECLPDDIGVRLTADRSVAVGVLTTELTANANGTFTCGEMPTSTEIIEYRWDLDGDGVYEERGAELERFVVTIDEPGDHVINVEVVDTDGATAQATTTLEVLESLDPQDALDRATILMSGNPFITECTEWREVCVDVVSPLELDVDVAVRLIHEDGRVVDERFDGVLLGPDERTSLCMTTSVSAGEATIELTSGDAFRSVSVTLIEAYQPADCAP